MTVQDRINGVVERISKAIEKAKVPEEESNQIMEELAEVAFGWLEAKAAAETLMVVVGLMVDKYPPNLAQNFMRECVQFAQHDELDMKKADGISYIQRVYDPEVYDQLMQIYLERARDELLPEESAGKTEETWNGGNAKHFVEVADQLPEEAGTAKKTTRKQAGVKTAARVAAAGKKTVAQTRKKATGAADGK